MAEDVTGGGKFMGTEGVERTECKQRVVKNHEEDAERLYKWQVTPFTGVRSQRQTGHFDRGETR